MALTVIQADYLNVRHAQDIGELLDRYARDPMGGGKPLAAGIPAKLAAELAQVPNAFSILCYLDDKPVALANCFQGFSTFHCKPLINIHDLMVDAELRGLGISQLLLSKVEEVAIGRGCCKITLEVLERNIVAQQAYKKSGFGGYELDPAMGRAVFWQKVIS